MCGGWTGASERSWLVDGPSPSTVLVPAQSKSRRLAAKACWAAWVRMADQRERREAWTAWRRMSGAALALAWASKRKQTFFCEGYENRLTSPSLGIRDR